MFATEALKAECGVRRDGDEAAFAERLMVDTADISGAFWATKWGAAMRDELDRMPFDPCARANKPSLLFPMLQLSMSCACLVLVRLAVLFQLRQMGGVGDPLHRVIRQLVAH